MTLPNRVQWSETSGIANGEEILNSSTVKRHEEPIFF